MYTPEEIAKTKAEQKRFEKFTKELAELSKKHGFLLEISGGVITYDLNDPVLENLSYTNDVTSGDLYPNYVFEE